MHTNVHCLHVCNGAVISVMIIVVSPDACLRRTIATHNDNGVDL